MALLSERSEKYFSTKNDSEVKDEPKKQLFGKKKKQLKSCYLGSSSTSDPFFVVKYFSDRSESSAIRSALKNWVYIAGAARSIKMFRTLFTPHYEKGRRFLGKR